MVLGSLFASEYSPCEILEYAGTEISLTETWTWFWGYFMQEANFFAEDID